MAPKLSKLAGTPMNFKPKNVDNKAKGITTTTARLALKLDKNKYKTKDTSSAPSTKFLNTVAKVLPINHVRS